MGENISSIKLQHKFIFFIRHILNCSQSVCTVQSAHYDTHNQDVFFHFNFSSSKRVNRQITYFSVLPKVSEMWFFFEEKEDTELQIILQHVQRNQV